MKKFGIAALVASGVVGLLVWRSLFLTGSHSGFDLLDRYPTKLTRGDAVPGRARPWEFDAADVFQVANFKLEVTNQLKLELGPASVGIGHCSEGAVWGLVLAKNGGKLTSAAADQPEEVSHVWLRFHPSVIKQLFPPDTVSTGGANNQLASMRMIAASKFGSSWHAGPNALIPEPKDLTVDVDTKGGSRRFFAVDTTARSAEYMAAFESRPVKTPPTLTRGLAQAAFDQLWQAFDRDYAMFILRPEIDWTSLREEYRPKALAAHSTAEFAAVCAEMLKPLRDLHVWLTVADANVPVFNRPRLANANPSALPQILGEVHETGTVRWAISGEALGFMAIPSWTDPELPKQCDEVLEQLRDTRGLILDVRLNGGGSEGLAGEVAGRFLDKQFVYAFSQFRNGPAHTNLTDKFERTVGPRGSWRYTRQVLLLIGQKCMSSNESFIAMMSGATNVTILGDHTCGSSGNPEIIHLPLDMTVSVPRWIDYLPDRTPLDERGFQPQVRFDPAPEAFEGARDDLLSAALDRLRNGPQQPSLNGINSK